MSGYSASTSGAFIGMCSLQNCPMGFPINSSKVALHARATLEAPGVKKKTVLENNFFLYILNGTKEGINKALNAVLLYVYQ